MANDLNNLKLIQATLPIVAILASFTSMYCNANIILLLYNERVSIWRKALFVFISGPVLSVLPMYIAYIVGSSGEMSPIIYLLLRNVNPIFALFYAYFGMKILKLSPIRSLRLMNISFLIHMIEINISLFIGSAIFEQTDSLHYDIYKDFQGQVFILAFLLLCYFMIYMLIKKWQAIIKILDSLFADAKKGIALYFLRSLIAYVLAVSLPMVMEEKSLAYLLISLIIFLILAICILIDYRKALDIELENVTAHINVYKEGVESFHGIKHDFYNILQTYGGYLDIGDLEGLRRYHSTLKQITIAAGDVLDLSNQMEKNPALISLVYNKLMMAKEFGVHIDVSIQNDLSNLPIDPMDLCRALGCLFDNAIEAASESEQKHMQFTIKKKFPSSMLIILSNSTKDPVDTTEIMKNGFSSKEGHSGIGLTTVRKTLGKYGNCSFHMNYYNQEISAYIELVLNEHQNNIKGT